MFNRRRFCFLETSVLGDGDDFDGSRKWQVYEPRDHRFKGVHLEAERCGDGVWKVLDCEPVFFITDTNQ